MRHSNGCLTHQLAKLVGDIKKYWWDLSDLTKRRVRQYFIVDDRDVLGGTVKVALRLGVRLKSK